MTTEKKFNYGGQAVIEGVMMRGSRAVAVAVRNPKGEIVLHTEPLNQAVYNGKWIKTPFVRGLVLLWDALGLGTRALMFSAEVAGREEGQPDDQPVFSQTVQTGTLILSFALSIGLFFVLPALLGGWILRWLGNTESAELIANISEGIIRLLLLVGYISAISMMEEVRRLFGYHGAEHKTINAYEAKAPLTPASVARFPLEHPRCGTAFLLTVVIISVILFILLPLEPLVQLVGPILARVVSRLLLLPVVAGLAYEVIRWTAKHRANPIVNLLIRPNLWLQRLTTREPDLEMLAVAITAFERVLKAEEESEIHRETMTLPAYPK